MEKELLEQLVKSEYQNICINFKTNEELRDRVYDNLCKDCLVKSKCLKKVGQRLSYKKDFIEKKITGIYYFIIIKKPCNKSVSSLVDIDAKFLQGSLVGHEAKIEYDSTKNLMRVESCSSL